MSDREQMSTSFGRAAATYEAGRPEYPAAAVEWMLAPVSTRAPLRVADVGAGTGKLTRALLAVEAEVVAVDPDPAMLDQLRAGLPDVRTVEGQAERMPLPDASVDAVVLGQAWHWVDPDAGSREIGRVLAPGGVLGLVWNIRDEHVPWVARLTEIMHGSNAEQLIADGGPRVAEPFETLERREWTWTRRMSPHAVLDMVRSRSYVITAEPEERARIEREVADHLARHPSPEADGSIDMPYVTHAFRAVLRG
ncbi:MAG: methyltransferase domain-containing protein [Microbacterium sp.]|uniref:class I SAM-dependent methyltransferase n=1 Tax=Microbacterium sp. TaxID=51671 RepID=UPI002723C746|nr:methyltransferase domain-containing protein [Microbacterium sp.]MDO8382367.1 methyltransferase domain-containing protein [Microbacterium sp.]